MDEEIHSFSILEPDSNLFNPFIQVFGIAIEDGMANVSHKGGISGNDRLDGNVRLFVDGVLLRIIVSVSISIGITIHSDIVNRPGIEQHPIDRVFSQPLI